MDYLPRPILAGRSSHEERGLKSWQVSSCADTDRRRSSHEERGLKSLDALHVSVHLLVAPRMRSVD